MLCTILRILSISGTTALLSIVLSACQFIPGTDDYKIDAAREQVRHALIDGESARFRDEKVYGLVVCGEVNGKNRMAAYTGFTPYMVTGEQVEIADQDDTTQTLLTRGFGECKTAAEKAIDRALARSGDSTASSKSLESTPPLLGSQPSPRTLLPNLNSGWLVGTWSDARNNPSNNPSASCETDVILQFKRDGTVNEDGATCKFATDGTTIRYTKLRSVPDPAELPEDQKEIKALPDITARVRVIDKNTFEEDGQKWRRCKRG